jgi:23S rRNA U2552 (ribose-2'-O)-methylase RlmE/FtsJ
MGYVPREWRQHSLSPLSSFLISMNLMYYLHEPLPNETPPKQQQQQQQHRHYALMCHKNEASRIRDALLQSSDQWLDISIESAQICKSSDERSDLSVTQCITIPLQEEKGRRKDRQGYTLMVIVGAAMPPAKLMHMARKQISWAGRLSHRTRSDVSRLENVMHSNHDHTIMASVGEEVWKQLCTIHGFDVDVDSLRFDVHPKSFNVEACKAIQQAAAKSKGKELSEGGLIKLTYSATKARCVIAMIVRQLSGTSIFDIYWGISTGQQHWNELNQTMNDNATKEILIETTDSVTGLDITKQITIPSETPVSRAYYKLDQVFDDRDNLHVISCLHGSDCSVDMLLSHGAGIDIGAAPGGWTQVMHSKLKIPSIAAIDPGILAKRVATLPGVHHIRNDISSNETIKLLATYAPFSLIVCDACVDVASLFEKIVQSLQGVSSLLKSPNQVFSWPLCLVVTLKFPHKTSGSIDRHMDRAERTISDFLRKVMSLGCDEETKVSDIEVKYKICHLFANSVAERCLIAVFNKASIT